MAFNQRVFRKDNAKLVKVRKVFSLIIITL